MAPACYPSTAKRGKWSLLCESSLTQSPSIQEPGQPGLRLVSMAHSWLGTGRPVRIHIKPNLLCRNYVPSPSCPHLSYKPTLLSSAMTRRSGAVSKV
ncbi:hypothetical protein NC651_022460 [Populus alba x Populus x berolinensis]|nr:hypothetical protein NC651_022460 [Populus alba x Populus x berolinensis]